MRLVSEILWILGLLSLALGLLLASQADAQEVVRLEFEAGKIFNYHNKSAPQYTLLQESKAFEDQDEVWNSQVSLNLDLNVFSTEFGYMYWDQEVEAQATTNRYRRVHWDFEVGFSFDDAVDVFWEHRSEHLLDVLLPDYPLKDVYGLRFCLIGTGCRR